MCYNLLATAGKYSSHPEMGFDCSSLIAFLSSRAISHLATKFDIGIIIPRVATTLPKSACLANNCAFSSTPDTAGYAPIPQSSIPPLPPPPQP